MSNNRVRSLPSFIRLFYALAIFISFHLISVSPLLSNQTIDDQIEQNLTVQLMRIKQSPGSQSFNTFTELLSNLIEQNQLSDVRFQVLAGTIIAEAQQAIFIKLYKKLITENVKVINLEREKERLRKQARFETLQVFKAELSQKQNEIQTLLLVAQKEENARKMSNYELIGNRIMNLYEQMDNEITQFKISEAAANLPWYKRFLNNKKVVIGTAITSVLLAAAGLWWMKRQGKVSVSDTEPEPDKPKPPVASSQPSQPVSGPSNISSTKPEPPLIQEPGVSAPPPSQPVSSPQPNQPVSAPIVVSPVVRPPQQPSKQHVRPPAQQPRIVTPARQEPLTDEDFNNKPLLAIKWPHLSDDQRATCIGSMTEGAYVQFQKLIRFAQEIAGFWKLPPSEREWEITQHAEELLSFGSSYDAENYLKIHSLIRQRLLHELGLDNDEGTLSLFESIFEEAMQKPSEKDKKAFLQTRKRRFIRFIFTHFHAYILPNDWDRYLEENSDKDIITQIKRLYELPKKSLSDISKSFGNDNNYTTDYLQILAMLAGIRGLLNSGQTIAEVKEQMLKSPPPIHPFDKELINLMIAYEGELRNMKLIADKTLDADKQPDLDAKLNPKINEQQAADNYRKIKILYEDVLCEKFQPLPRVEILKQKLELEKAEAERQRREREELLQKEEAEKEQLRIDYPKAIAQEDFTLARQLADRMRGLGMPVDKTDTDLEKLELLKIEDRKRREVFTKQQAVGSSVVELTPEQLKAKELEARAARQAERDEKTRKAKEAEAALKEKEEQLKREAIALRAQQEQEEAQRKQKEAEMRANALKASQEKAEQERAQREAAAKEAHRLELEQRQKEDEERIRKEKEREALRKKENEARDAAQKKLAASADQRKAAALEAQQKAEQEAAAKQEKIKKLQSEFRDALNDEDYDEAKTLADELEALGVKASKSIKEIEKLEKRKEDRERKQREKEQQERERSEVPVVQEGDWRGAEFED